MILGFYLIELTQQLGVVNSRGMVAEPGSGATAPEPGSATPQTGNSFAGNQTESNGVDSGERIFGGLEFERRNYLSTT